MTTEEAFLAAIREAPDDDAPRLIFADWLEDNGDPDRAEFVRLMVQVARRPGGEAGGLRDQAGGLLVRNWRRWVKPLREAVGPNAHEPWLTAGPAAAAVKYFPRGFVDRLTLDAPRFLQKAEALLRLTQLTDLSFRRAGGKMAQVAGRAELQWIRRLAFVDFYSSPLDATDAAALAQSPYAGRLQDLSLFRNNLGDAGVRALTEARWLGHLQVLDLTENGLSSLGARLLAEVPFTNLRRLRLSQNTIGDDGAAALARAPWLAGLEKLNIEWAGVTDRGVQLLLEHAPSTLLYHDPLP